MQSMRANIVINDRTFSWCMEHDPAFRADAIVHECLLKNSVPEPEVLALMYMALRPGDTAVDAGANIGFFTLFMQQLVGEIGTVTAFEPSRLNYNKLKQNIRGVAGVQAINCALYDENISLPWYEQLEDTGQSSLVPPKSSLEKSYDVEACRLSDWLVLDTPRLIKIDCEGAEEHVLRGAEPILKRGVPFVVCELSESHLLRMGSSTAEVRQYMDDLGYSMWLLKPDGSIPPCIPLGTYLVTGRSNLNVLFATAKSVSELWSAVDADAGSTLEWVA